MAAKIDTGGSGYKTPADLQKEVDRLSAVKASKDGSYTIDGKRLTPAQRNSVISDAKSKVSKAKKVEETTPKLQPAKTSPNVLRDLKLDLNKIDSSQSALEKKLGSTKNVKDFDLLNSWIDYYENVRKDVSDAIKSAEKGSFVSPIKVEYTKTGTADSWKSSKPPKISVSQPVPTGGKPFMGTQPSSPFVTNPATNEKIKKIIAGPGSADTKERLIEKVIEDSKSVTKPDTGGKKPGTVVIPPVSPKDREEGGIPKKPGGGTTGGTGGTGGTPPTDVVDSDSKPTEDPEGKKPGGSWLKGTDGKWYYLEPDVDFGGLKPDKGEDKPGDDKGEIPTDWETAAEEQYGLYYGIIKSIPEIKLLLKKAIDEKYSENKFFAELVKTTWYKTTSATAREWDMGQQRDPASYQQKIDLRIANIKNSALSKGLRFSDETLSVLARDSLRGGWDEQTLQNAIGSEALKSTGGTSQLRSGYIGQNLKRQASQYGVVLSDVTFNSWINKVATGEETDASFQAYALQMAKNLFPGISAQLDAGQTFDQITDPYRQLASRTLEINPETVDFLDPKWAKAVTFMTDKGEQRPMNFNEWGDYLRQTQSFGYEYTEQARSRAYGVSETLANIFGKV